MKNREPRTSKKLILTFLVILCTAIVGTLPHATIADGASGNPPVEIQDSLQSPSDTLLNQTEESTVEESNLVTVLYYTLSFFL